MFIMHNVTIIDDYLLNYESKRQLLRIEQRRAGSGRMDSMGTGG